MRCRRCGRVNPCGRQRFAKRVLPHRCLWHILLCRCRLLHRRCRIYRRLYRCIGHRLCRRRIIRIRRRSRRIVHIHLRGYRRYRRGCRLCSGCGRCRHRCLRCLHRRLHRILRRLFHRFSGRFGCRQRTAALTANFCRIGIRHAAIFTSHTVFSVKN